MGHSPLSWGEIMAWGSLTGVQITPWEVDTLRAMDRGYLKAVAEANEATRG
jgi:hypothetical protein